MFHLLMRCYDCGSTIKEKRLRLQKNRVEAEQMVSIQTISHIGGMNAKQKYQYVTKPKFIEICIMKWCSLLNIPEYITHIYKIYYL